MKFNRNIFTILLVLGLVSACDLDLLDNPNVISPEQASLNDVYNAVQLDFRDVLEDAERGPGQAARMYMGVSYTYESLYTAGTFNALWGDVYNDLFPNIDALITLSDGQGFDIHVGTAMVMKAYTMMVLVDLLGDVPYLEAGQGIDIISPGADPGADVYAAAITMLDDAIALLAGSTAPKPVFENFYDSDVDKWITAANTIKMRAYLNIGDAASLASFDAITNFIDDESEDFQFNYGSQRDNPNSRHPNYNNHYETGDGAYMGTYYMWLLRGEKLDAGGLQIKDPRLRYYFYRKVSDSEGQDQTTYSCHFSEFPDQGDQPAWYAAADPRMPYCIPSSDGYSGRDHMNGEGIPPDGNIRTSWGLYPQGGDFDDDTFDDTRESGTTGGLGAGIMPIMLTSYVNFMRAERAVLAGDDVSAKTLMMAGVQASLDKVKGFEGLVQAKMSSDVANKDGTPSGITVEEQFGMSTTSQAAYITELGIIYDASSNKMDVVIKEFLIAAFGNGLEAYNMYRRTGMPLNMAPALESAPGKFPLSFLYPSNSTSRNANITQKGDLGTSVFWQDATVASGLK